MMPFLTPVSPRWHGRNVEQITHELGGLNMDSGKWETGRQGTVNGRIWALPCELTSPGSMAELDCCTVSVREKIYNVVMAEYPCSVGKAVSKKER